MGAMQVASSRLPPRGCAAPGVFFRNTHGSKGNAPSGGTPAHKGNQGPPACHSPHTLSAPLDNSDPFWLSQRVRSTPRQQLEASRQRLQAQQVESMTLSQALAKANDNEAIIEPKNRSSIATIMITAINDRPVAISSAVTTKSGFCYLRHI